MLTENLLNAFLELAKTGSFQSAARALGVSDASLSRYIRQAEEELGFPLFVRGRENNRLTPAGHDFLPIALELKQNLGQFSRRVENIRMAGGGILKIGCGPLTTRTLIQPVLAEVLQSIPNLRCEIVVMAAKEPMKMLAGGEIDVFVGDLTHTSATDQVDVEIQVLKKQPVIFVARNDHALHNGGPYSISDVFEFPFASPFLHRHWRMSLTQALGGTEEAVRKVDALPQVQCDDYAMLISLVSDSDLVAGGMQETFSEAIALGQLKKVRMNADLMWNICAARQVNQCTPALMAFWKGLLRMNAAKEEISKQTPVLVSGHVSHPVT